MIPHNYTPANIISPANILKIGLFNVNSLKVKEQSDDRTSELSKIFNISKAHLFIITETKLNEVTINNFIPNYLGKLWKHSITTDEDAGAGVSIAYDPLMGTCEKLQMPLDIQNRSIAIKFTPPNVAAFIIMGIYVPASGAETRKRAFLNKIFAARSMLQAQHNCNIIMGGDFNSTVAHLIRNMWDYKFANFKPDATSRLISTHLSACNYIHPFESVASKSIGSTYLTFRCVTNKNDSLTSSKGIDHFFFPAAMSDQLRNLRISDDFFAGSKHKPVFIEINNIMSLPINIIPGGQYIPPVVWNDPEFINSSNLIYRKYIQDAKHTSNLNWDALMVQIKASAIQLKNTMLKNLKHENNVNPNPETASKIQQFYLQRNISPSQWSRSVSNTIPNLLNIHGNITNSHKDMCSSAAVHLASIFKNSDSCPTSTIDNFLLESTLPKFTPEEKIKLEFPFALDELNDIVTSMLKGKSNGKDDLPIDIFKNSIDLTTILMECANNTFQRSQPLPESFRSVLFRLIKKDPDLESTDLDNYRPIGLLSMAYRIISKAITNRLQPMLPRLIGDHQYAYVNGRRGENIGRIISELMLQTTTVPNFNILTLKLDFRKAFDSMSHQYINRFLAAIDTPNMLTNFIMHLLTSLNGAIIINNGVSETFQISRGTTQGSALSAILFVLCLEGLCNIAISNPEFYGAVKIPCLKLSLSLLAFADDTKIITTLARVAAWLTLLSRWGALSGVILNIPKCLLNFWSHEPNLENIHALKQLLLTHPCLTYQKAGVFDGNSNKNGWRIVENGPFKLLGVHYNFTPQYPDRDSQDHNFNVTTNKLISFTSDTWKLKNPISPDPRIKLACALYAASDNMFDRLVDCKTLWVSGLIFRFYNCPTSIKVMLTNQNQANVVLLSHAAIHSPCIKLTTLLQPYADGGCNMVYVQAIQKSISVHTIILLLSGMCDTWLFATYRRDLLRIVHANYTHILTMQYLPYEMISQAGLHYLFGLPLICTRVLQYNESILWSNYASISGFISLPKRTISTLKKGNNLPTKKDLLFFHQLLHEPLWLNNLFLDPLTSKVNTPTSPMVDLLLFNNIWSIQLRSISLQDHVSTCSATCKHNHECALYWTRCIPTPIVEFAEWCSPFYTPGIHTNDNKQLESTEFTLQIHPNPTHEAVPLPQCSVKLLTTYYTSLKAGPPDVNSITGVCTWIEHWPQYKDTFTWKAYFELLEIQDIDKSARDAYWRLLHRCHVPRSSHTITETPYAYCKLCETLNMQVLFNPEHAIFGCPRTIQFWKAIASYIVKINPHFEHTISFLTIISLGLHNMKPIHDFPINIRTATHNIIGLGIKTLTKFPIDSATSLLESLNNFRQQIRHFIKFSVEARINIHTEKHGTDPDYVPALRISIASAFSLWTILRDNNPASTCTPAWSDYTYVDPV